LDEADMTVKLDGYELVEVFGAMGLAPGLSINPEGEQSTQHQLCVGVNQVGILVQFLSNRVLDKAQDDKQSKAPFGAKLLI
jgi:hypothetical protein